MTERESVEKRERGRNRVRVADPETADETVSAATGRGWDDWCDVIDAWPGHTDGHGAIAAHLSEAHGVEPWWSQTITVGYERITGRRLPYQRPDGTFTASKSATVPIGADALRKLLLDGDDRVDLFPGLDVELRSQPSSKTIRLRIGPGIALVDLEPRDDRRTTVTVAHEGLPHFDDVADWKSYWSEWFQALDDGDRSDRPRSAGSEPDPPEELSGQV